MVIQTIEKYLLSPILSRNHPSGKPNIPTTRYVTVIFLPAVTCENRTGLVKACLHCQEMEHILQVQAYTKMRLASMYNLMLSSLINEISIRFHYHFT